ncbi:MAG: solute carrier family 23 protein [Tissierellaceae bacterium]|nr:solute carrier family 23 protein [Tissierellaceae bacterium]
MTEKSTVSSLNNQRIIYKVEDKPKNLRDMLILGFQHPLTMFGAMTMTPLVVASATGMSPTQTALLLSLAMVGSGLATVVQTTKGVRLPVIQTMSLAFMAAYIAIANQVTAETGVLDPLLIMRYIGGAVILGGIIEAIVGFSGLIGLLKRIITPIVTGPVILLICLVMAELIVDWASGNWIITLVTAALTIIMSSVIPSTKWGKDKPYIRATSVIVPVTIMYLLSMILSKSGVISPDSPAYIDVSVVAGSPWLVLPIPFTNWGPPLFRLDFLLIIISGYVISIIESIGQYYANASVSGLDEPLSTKRVSNGIAAEGVGCLLSGLVGGLASTSAGENIGLVETTGVASRHIARVGGFMLIGLGFIGKFAALITSISQPILAGVFISIIGSVGGVGIKEFAKVPLTNRNLSIFGISLIFGLGMPPYINGNPVVMPGVEWLANTINGMLSSMMTVGGVMAIILNQILPGSDEEKGVNANEEPARLV